MIIGSGMMARAMKDRGLIFASGVSNSLENRESEFIREQKLLREHLKDGIVYFSTTSHADTPYVMHKRKMESIVMTLNDYTILRLPQVVGKGGNVTNLFNFIKQRLSDNELIPVYHNTYRALIDVEDLAKIVENIQGHKGIFSLYGIEHLRIGDIVRLMAGYMKCDAKMAMVYGVNGMIKDNTPLIDWMINYLEIGRENYTKRLIEKYL